MIALHHANFLSRPVFTCQAIAILGLCGHNVCDSDLLSSLFSHRYQTCPSAGSAYSRKEEERNEFGGFGDGEKGMVIAYNGGLVCHSFSGSMM